MKPSREDALLFALCRQRLTDADRALIRDLASSGIDWPAFVGTAEQHGVAPLVAANLFAAATRTPGLDDAVREKLNGLMIRNMALEQVVDGRLAAILAFFAGHGIEVMPIKGAVMKRLVYERPWATTAWDVDLVLGVGEEQIGSELRAEIGRFLSRGPCYIEYNYRTHHDLVTPGGLRLDFDAIWTRSRTVDVAGRAARVMDPEDLLIAACINSCRKRYFRLKAMFDVAGIVETWPHIDAAAVARRASDAGCKTIVYAALDCARRALGAPVPRSLLEALEPHPARRVLIHALASRMSFSSLQTLFGGFRLLGRHLGAGVLLPYATYSPRHVAASVRHLLQAPRSA